MKKFIFKLFYFGIFFTLSFIIINVIFLFSIITTDWGIKKRIESLRFDNPDFELLVLGASTSLDGFDAELLTFNGIKTYNLALGGTTVKTSYIQLEEYLEKYSNQPSCVLLGLNSVNQGNFDIDTIHPVVEITMKDYHYRVSDIPIIRYRWLAFELFKKIVSSEHRKAELSYGQLKFQKKIPDNTHFVEQYLNLPKVKSSYWVGEIAKLCTQTGSKLLIIEMPGSKDTQNLSEIGPYELSFMNGSSALLYNLASRDFCKIFDKNNDWIANSHLNEFGAIKFTNEIIKLLEEGNHL